MKTTNLPALIKTAEAAIKKHTPEILTGIGIAGMITTTVLAVRATPKAVQLLEEKKKLEQVDKLKPVDVVKTTWKQYIPAAVTCTASVACLVGASRICLRRNAMLATAYKLSETALIEYREKVLETVGEKKEQAARDKVAEEKINQNPASTTTIIVTDKGKTRCFDPLTSRYWTCDLDTIQKAENRLNKRMLHDIGGTVSVNEFYDEIGLDRTDTGDEFGWNTEHLIDLDISSHVCDDGIPANVIGHYNAPKYEYSKY